MRDLFINGTSIASGWSQGYKPDPNNYSWANYFANLINSENMWNVSYVSKPIQVTIEHTIGFCEQYYEKYGTYENLLAMVELLLPQNVKWPSVSFKNKEISDVISPVVVFKNKEGIANTDTYSDIGTMFIRHKAQIDYLSQQSHFEYVPHSEVDSIDYEIHAHKLQTYYADNNALLAKRLHEANQEINFLHEWLTTRNINYLMFWGCGIGNQFHKIVDRSISTHNRLIPMQKFTCFSKAIEWSVKPDGYHPDQTGHKKIADYLFSELMDRSQAVSMLKKIN